MSIIKVLMDGIHLFENDIDALKLIWGTEEEGFI